MKFKQILIKLAKLQEDMVVWPLQIIVVEMGKHVEVMEEGSLHVLNDQADSLSQPTSISLTLVS